MRNWKHMSVVTCIGIICMVINFGCVCLMAYNVWRLYGLAERSEAMRLRVEEMEGRALDLHNRVDSLK